jgi:hypothetical protein
MQAQESEAKPPLRLPRLPHPRRPLVERRQNRPKDTASALIAAFDHAVARADLDALIVTDEAGILVSNNTTELDLTMLAAVTPLVARGTAKAMIRRDGAPLEFSVRAVEVLGETLYVGALGGNFSNRERELAASTQAARRILLS